MGLTSRSTLPYHQPAPSPARDVITNSLDLNPNPQIDSAHFGHREHPDRSMVNAQIGAW
jgi:hypothetical protein